MLTLESVHRRAIAQAEATPLAYVVARYWPVDADPAPWQAINDGSTVGDVAAFVNHGQWQTDCPVDGCRGSTLASDTDHRFVCITCGAGPFAVVWPVDRAEIEAALEPRPVTAQNWTPAETVADLIAENETRGL